jgi:hypothetical protein
MRKESDNMDCIIKAKFEVNYFENSLDFRNQLTDAGIVVPYRGISDDGYEAYIEDEQTANSISDVVGYDVDLSWLYNVHKEGDKWLLITIQNFKE